MRGNKLFNGFRIIVMTICYFQTIADSTCAAELQFAHTYIQCFAIRINSNEAVQFKIIAGY